MSELFKTQKNWRNKIELMEYNGSEETVVIPSDVCEIQQEVFKDHTEIKKVILPEGLEYIGWGAFDGCTGLEEITIPSSVQIINKYAFKDCISLVKVDAPETFNSIGKSMFVDKAFSGCTSLSKIEFSVSYKGFPGNLFEGCTSLSKIIMGDRSAKIYGKEKRDICEPFIKIAIPEQLETPVVKRQLMSEAAKNILSGSCDEVYKSSWIKYIKSQRNACFEQIKKDKALSELVIKEGVLKPEELDNDIISYDISYEEAKKKYTITKRKTGFSINDFTKDGRIGGPMGDDWHYEFKPWSRDPSKLIYIPNTIDGKPIGHVAVKTIPFDAIVICDATTFAKLDRRVKASTSVAYLEDESQFKKDEEAKIIDFIKKNPLDVAGVLVHSNVPKAFNTYVKIGKPDKATLDVMVDLLRDNMEIMAILLDALNEKPELDALDFDSVKKVSISDLKKEWAYEKENILIHDKCVSGIRLKKYKGINPEVLIPETIGKIKVLAVRQGCFENNKIVESVTIPSSIQQIEYEAFKGCENLRKVVVLGEEVEVGRTAFKDCVSLEEVDFDVKSVMFNKHPFMGCKKLFDDNGLLEIDNVLVDSECPIDKKELTVPEGITKIGDNAFTELTESFNNTIWNKNLRSIILPSTIKEIGESAFYGCKVLQNVSIPEGLEKIENWSFRKCDSLREIHIPKSVVKIGNSVFDDKVVIYGFPGSEAEKYAKTMTYASLLKMKNQKAKIILQTLLLMMGCWSNT